MVVRHNHNLDLQIVLIVCNGQEKRESAFSVLSLQRGPYADIDMVIYNRGGGRT